MIASSMIQKNVGAIKARISLSIGVIFKLYRIMWKVWPVGVLYVVITRAIQIFIPGLQLFLTTKLIDSISNVIASGSNFNTVFLIIALQLILLSCNSIVKSADRLLLFHLKAKCRFFVQNKISQRTTKLPLVKFESAALYDEIYKASLGDRSLDLIDISLQVIQDIFTITTYISIIGFLLNWWFSSILFFLFLVSLIVNIKTGKLKFSQTMYQAPATRKMTYLYNLLTGKEAAKEIRTFNIGNYLQTKWENIYWDNFRQQKMVETKAVGLVMGVDLLIIFSVQLITFYLVTIILKLNITIGLFVAITQALVISQSTISILSMQLSHIYSNALYSIEMLNFMENSQEDRKGETSSHWSFKKEILIEELSFKYPMSSDYILKDLSFCIKKGQKIAIVGENGAGKSTLAKCLLGLYKPTSGKITVDNVEIQDIDEKSFRQNVSSLFQDYVKYQLSLRENIGFGQIDKIYDDTVLEEALTKSNMSLDSFSKGLNTQLGTIFNDGVDVSIGQWQKICLSRAFLSNAEFIILDEPTSALDPMTEVEYFDKFSNISSDKTTIFITHRLGVCKFADHILVLKDGELVEQGCHNELINNDGLYSRMYSSQASWYK